jgi:hypothetical protein
VTDDELKQLFDAMRQESAAARQENAAARQENAAAHAETRRHVDETAVAMRLQFDIAVEDSKSRFDLLAEGLKTVDEKLGRKIADLEERMERGFEETQAMIKFSHAELDRRVRSLEALEETVADLQARVERLESSTH